MNKIRCKSKFTEFEHYSKWCMLQPLCSEIVKQTLGRTCRLFVLQLGEVSKNFNQYGRNREVGNTAGTHSEDYSFKPTSSRQLFRMIFFVVFLRLPLNRHKKHNNKAPCSGMLHRVR
jgi:hypothetical protein